MVLCCHVSRVVQEHFLWGTAGHFLRTFFSDVTLGSRFSSFSSPLVEAGSFCALSHHFYHTCHQSFQSNTGIQYI